MKANIQPVILLVW